MALLCLDGVVTLLSPSFLYFPWDLTHSPKRRSRRRNDTPHNQQMHIGDTFETASVCVMMRKLQLWPTFLSPDLRVFGRRHFS